MSSAKWRPFCLGLNVLKCDTADMLWRHQSNMKGMLKRKVAFKRFWKSAKKYDNIPTWSNENYDYSIHIFCLNSYVQIIRANWRRYAANLTFIQIMACRMVGAKPLCELMLEYG